MIESYRTLICYHFITYVPELLGFHDVTEHCCKRWLADSYTCKARTIPNDYNASISSLRALPYKQITTL